MSIPGLQRLRLCDGLSNCDDEEMSHPSSPSISQVSNLSRSPDWDFSGTPSSRGSSVLTSPSERMFATASSTGSNSANPSYRRIRSFQRTGPVLQTAEATNAAVRSQIHEIKNGVNAVLGTVDNLNTVFERKKNKLPEDFVKEFETVLKDTKLVSEFLYHTCKSNLGGNNWETYDLKDIRTILESSASNDLTKKKIDLKWVFSPSISSNRKGPNRYWISNVLLNFLNNAIQYSKEKGTIEVGIKDVERKGNDFKVKFSVRDEGKGMDPKDVGKLFAKNRLAGVAIQLGAKDQGGTGLGLSTCIENVAQMNFADPDQVHIGAHSDGIGKGSTFWFDAPFSRVEENPAAPIVTEKAFPENQSQPTANIAIRSGQTTDFSGLKVLVAEDNEVNKKVLDNLLGKLKVDARKFVQNGQEAFNEIKNGEYNLVFMDLKMPGVDGRKGVQMIRQYERDYQKSPVRIILCSGNAEESLPEVDGLLPKPLHLEGVKQICEKFNIPSAPLAVPTSIINLAGSSETDNIELEMPVVDGRKEVRMLREYEQNHAGVKQICEKLKDSSINGEGSFTSKGQQVPYPNFPDNSADSALKNRDCAYCPKVDSTSKAPLSSPLKTPSAPLTVPANNANPIGSSEADNIELFYV